MPSGRRSSLPLPKTWTQVQAVIEIPAGVDAVGPSLFDWWTKGAIFVDDFSITKVDASAPVTPLVQTAAPVAAAPSGPPEIIPATGRSPPMWICSRRSISTRPAWRR
ncbi:MAG: hypothetical protein WDO13_21945 [Verrucomicrobiota bacterium]